MTDFGSTSKADLMGRIADVEDSFTERKLEGAKPEEHTRLSTPRRRWVGQQRQGVRRARARDHP